jgi:hypothetical protein
MKKAFVLVFGMVLVMSGFVMSGQEDEKAAVKKAIVEGYIDGIFLMGDPELVRKRWHEECDIVVYMNKKLQKFPAIHWVERLEKKSGPLLPDVKVTHKFEDVKVVGNAAFVVVEIFLDGKKKYTDFMNLYKFDSCWKIVTKTFYEHF